MEKILLFYGKFNPLHKGHKDCAVAALDYMKSGGFNELWFIPKNKGENGYGEPLIDMEHRVAMIKLMINDYGFDNIFKICPIEKGMPDNVGKYAVIKEIMRKHPDKKFSYVICESKLPEVVVWRNSRKLRRNIPFVIVRCEKHGNYYDTNLLYRTPHKKTFKYLPYPILSFSSNKIRKYLKDPANKKVGTGISSSVENYIIDNNLYRLKTEEKDNLDIKRASGRTSWFQ